MEVTVEDQLKVFIVARYGTVKNFSKQINVPYSTIQTVFKRGVLNSGIGTLKKICSGLGISVDGLAEGEIKLLETDNNSKTLEKYLPISLNAREENLIVNYRKLNEFNQRTVEIITERMVQGCQTSVRTVQRPLYTLPASAGTGQFLDSDIYEMVDFPEDQVPTNSTLAIKVSGDSMEPLYEDGSIVFVKHAKTLEPSDIGIFILNGEGYIKKLGNRGELVSLNPKYSDIKITEYDDCRVVGKVVGKYHEK